MEWVEVTAKSVESAKELALDRLGISVDDAEFDVVETPRPGLFGRTRGEARVRARVKPAMVRQKLDRRGRRSSADGADRRASQTATATADDPRDGGTAAAETAGLRRRRRRATPTGNGASGREGRGLDRPATISPPAAIPSKER
jgi:spoIIIJ-associated protein